VSATAILAREQPPARGCRRSEGPGTADLLALVRAVAATAATEVEEAGSTRKRAAA